MNQGRVDRASGSVATNIYCARDKAAATYRLYVDVVDLRWRSQGSCWRGKARPAKPPSVNVAAADLADPNHGPCAYPAHLGQRSTI